MQRDHSRRYFTVEGMLRYYPYVGETVEWWVGGTGGLVVVSDRFVVKEDQEDDRALLGPRGVTVRTEGGTIGIAGGLVLSLAPHWSLGLTLRYGHWFLPDKPAHDPLGSEASLTGRDTVFSAGVAVRVPHRALALLPEILARADHDHHEQPTAGNPGRGPARPGFGHDRRATFQPPKLRNRTSESGDRERSQDPVEQQREDREQQQSSQRREQRGNVAGTGARPRALRRRSR